jgi:hypothetical protein
MEPAAIGSGTRYDGCRLPPGTWRVVQACLATRSSGADLANPAVLTECMADVRDRHPTWRAPHPIKLTALLQFLNSRRVLERVVSIARDDARPGIPDLFLFRISDQFGVYGGRFVEVKRKVRRTGYKEPLSRTQRLEHEELRSFGLVVEVVYLLE